MAEKSIVVNGMDCIHAIFGSYDENINIIQKEYNVSVYSRDGDIKVNGAEPNADAACAVIKTLEKMYNNGEAITEQNVRYTISAVNDGTQ